MAKTANYKYKCRLCGEIFIDGCSSVTIANAVIIAIALNCDSPNLQVGVSPTEKTTHLCKPHENGSMGIADFLGFVVEEEK